MTRLLSTLVLALFALPSVQEPRGAVARGVEGEEELSLQVALDRLAFSPGEIDGRAGQNTLRALAAFREARGLPADGALDEDVRRELGEHLAQPWAYHIVTDADLAGPFTERIPGDLMEQAELPALGYRSAWEMLGERFHASPRWLQAVNPDVTLEPGVRLRVPSVEPMVVPEHTGVRTTDNEVNAAATNQVRVFVSASRHALTVRDGADKILLYAPVTVGGAQDPLPTGAWTVVEVFDRPIFNYNPDLFWDADPSHAKARIPPGPNNPVGLVWIDLDLENYGLHGTPEPSRIGRSQSHGCVRLTNWDALRVAALVGRNTPVIFR